MENFIVNAESRSDLGKGASRRLRRDGMVPGIVYGGGQDAKLFNVVHTELEQHLEHEAFYSHILTLSVDGAEERVVLKDLQRHPAKPFVMHVDFLRVQDNTPLTMKVPLHFVGAAGCPGVKRGATATKYMTNVEITCLPANLPEYIEVDMSNMDVADSIHLADLNAPEGVKFPALARGAQHNYAVAAILGGRNVK